MSEVANNFSAMVVAVAASVSYVYLLAWVICKVYFTHKRMYHEWVVGTVPSPGKEVDQQR